MNILIIVIVIILALSVKAIYDEWSSKREAMQIMKHRWGTINTERMSETKRETISSFYEDQMDKVNDVDDITWNDLSLFELYTRINHCFSALGEEYLYMLLRKPIISDELLNERKRVIMVLENSEEERLRLGKLLLRIGKLKKISLYEYVKRLELAKPVGSIIHVLCSVFLLLSIGAIIFNHMAGILFLVFAIGFNILTYYHYKSKVEQYYDVVSYLIKLLHGVKLLGKEKSDELSAYMDECQKITCEFADIRRGAFLVFSGSQATGSLTDILFDYVQILFHFDLLKFNKMLSGFKKKKDLIIRLYHIVGFLDSMYSIASYRAYLGENNYCEPEFTHKRELEVEGLFHPLVDEPVKASIAEIKSVLLTGSNASGKSTFLKSLALNALFAQTTGTAFASKYKACRFRIYSSMALSDNLFENESYFIVEIKSLKRILDVIGEDIPTLCFVDEVLRGTNTLERIAAAAQILKDISEKNALCYAATHDIELTYILENHFSNYHFQEEIKDGEILFDYELYSGRAVSRNAIRLLELLGYQKEIVSDAGKLIQSYETENSWPVIE